MNINSVGAHGRVHLTQLTYSYSQMPVYWLQTFAFHNIHFLSNIFAKVPTDRCEYDVTLMF